MMASTKKSTRLSLPFMFAFRDAHEAKDAKIAGAGRTKASEGRIVASRASLRASITEPQLRAELSRDLDALLNTTNLASVIDLSGHDEVRRSIVNFGLPDIVSRTIDEARSNDIVGEIKEAIICYEPRILPKTISVKRDASVDSATLAIRFVVTGEMNCNPVAVPVEFYADLEVGTGKLGIRKR
jgi:type VI secretion system protein ImpF